MAFSTQKDFFNVPFMNETIEDECARACIQLKSYASTIDDRAWALDETNRSRFLTDLVTCKTPVDVSRGRSAGRGELGERGRRVTSDNMRVNPADSLIEATNVTLDKVQDLLQEKRTLQQKLNTSEENLRTAKAEYEKIRDIINRKYDRNEFKEYYNKLQQLAMSGKFSKDDERDFTQFFKRMEDLGKAFEVSQAENSYVKRLLEKLSRRAEMNKIPIEPEKSTDIPYLQDQVNKLRKELMTLRKMEDKKMFGSGEDGNLDAANLQAIVKERNSLRERLRAMKNIEKQVGELRKSLGEANQVTNSLSNNLNHNSKYIHSLENDMRDMQSHYEKIEQDRCCTMECMQRKLDDMQSALCKAKLEAQKVPHMQACMKRLEESLRQRDRRLCEYDAQFKQLMRVICELRSGASGCGGASAGVCPCGGNASRSRQDCETQTACNQAIDELAFYTSATLTHIQNELRKRGITCGMDNGGTSAVTSGGGAMHSDQCCQEVERLRKIIGDLQGDKSRLRLSMLEHSKNLDNLANRVDEMSNEVDQTVRDTAGVNQHLNNALDLVNDISNIQQRNDKLTRTFNELSQKDQQDLINDLQKRLKDCAEDKADLKQLLKQQGINPDDAIKQLITARQKGEAPPRGTVDMGPPIPGAPAFQGKTTSQRPSAIGGPSGTVPGAHGGGRPGSPMQPGVAGGQPGYGGPMQPGVAGGQPGYGGPVQPGFPGGPAQPGVAGGQPGVGGPMQPGVAGGQPGVGGPMQPGVAGGQPGFGGPMQPGVAGGQPGAGGPMQPGVAGGQPGYGGPMQPGVAGGQPGVGVPMQPGVAGGQPGVGEPMQPGVAGGQAGVGGPIQPGVAGGQPGYGGPMQPAVAGGQPGLGGPMQPGVLGGQPGYGGPMQPGQPGYDRQIQPGQVGFSESAFDPSQAGYGVPGVPGARPGESGYIQPGSGGRSASSRRGRRTGSTSSRAGPSGRTESELIPGIGGGVGGYTGGPRGAGDRKPGVGGTYRGVRRQPGDPGYDQYGSFVEESAQNLAVNLKSGSSLEREIKKILDAFVEECRHCLCQLKVPKSRFYAICHKILHQGIMSLSFKEMAYIHKKIYYAAEKLFPGCLLNIILTEYTDVVNELKKCCQCKEQLCCDSTQEMLKEKVGRLEVEVELAREYLDNMRSKGGLDYYESRENSELRESRDIGKARDSCRTRDSFLQSKPLSSKRELNDDDEDKDTTYRQRTKRSSPKYTTKQIKNIKACITRCSQNLK